MKRKYLLKKDAHDTRDFLSNVNLGIKLPSSFDLRKNCPPVFNQGDLGSCSSNAGVTSRMMMSNIEKTLSRLDLYYNERYLENTVNEDSGACMRDICVALSKFGVCEETFFPYVEANFTNPPSEEAITNGKNYKINAFKRITSVTQCRQYIVTHQQPVLMGMTVFESMESDEVSKTGFLPLPKHGEKKLGGHAVLVVGYKDISKTSWILSMFSKKITGYLIVRNSWGSDWADMGYFYVPYEFGSNTDYTSDLWVIS